MRKEVEGTCYIYTTHDLFTHTRPFPPLRWPKLGRGRKKAHSLSLSPGLTAEEGCAAFKLPPKSLQIQQSAKFHTKQSFPHVLLLPTNKCKNNDTRILLFLRGKTENIVLAHVLPPFYSPLNTLF